MASQRPNKTKRRAKYFLADFPTFTQSPQAKLQRIPGPLTSMHGLPVDLPGFGGSDHWIMGASKDWSELLNSKIVNDSRMICSPCQKGAMQVSQSDFFK